MAGNCCDTYFCFRDYRRAVVAIGMLTGGCSLVQILTTIAVFTGSRQVDVDNGDEALTYRLYIALSCFDFVIVIASFLLVYGNERSDEMSPRCFTLPWLILLPFYFIYETAINILYFYHQLNTGIRYQGLLAGGRSLGFVIVPLVYWILKAILMLISFFYIVNHMQRPQTPNIQYIRKVEAGMNDYEYAPTFPHSPPMMALPRAPTIQRPSSGPLSCTSCSGGCSGDRCNKCDLPKPLYGYAGGQTSGNTAINSGWTTSIFNTGR